MKRSAFTLVELLVVIAIIGMLIGLLLPAAQAVRTSAARLQSGNNLKQIGLALHVHHDNQKKFPPGYTSNPTGAGVNPETMDGPPGWAWSTYLLPYLDQGPLYSRLRLDLPAWDPANAELVKASIPTFINPGAPNQGATIIVRSETGTLAEWGRSHYVANNGQDETWAYPTQDLSKLPGVGPFYRNSKVRDRDVADGLSTTVFVGEHTTVSEKTWVAVHPQATCCPIDPQRHPFTVCDKAATLVLCHSGPAAGEPGVIHPPSFPTCHVCQMYAPWKDGGQVLFGDGHVQFISTSVNLDTWAALSSMRMGDTVGEH